MSPPRRNTTLEEVAAEIAWLRSEVVYLREEIANTPRLHRKDVMARYGISKSTLHRWLKLPGRLPRPVRFGGPLWRLADLEKAEAAGLLPRPVSA